VLCISVPPSSANFEKHVEQSQTGDEIGTEKDDSTGATQKSKPTDKKSLPTKHSKQDKNDTLTETSLQMLEVQRGILEQNKRIADALEEMNLLKKIQMNLVSLDSPAGENIES
jgi:hypothetical protein